MASFILCVKISLLVLVRNANYFSTINYNELLKHALNIKLCAFEAKNFAKFAIVAICTTVQTTFICT